MLQPTLTQLIVRLTESKCDGTGFRRTQEKHSLRSKRSFILFKRKVFRNFVVVSKKQKQLK